jgi:hypothetical protein
MTINISKIQIRHLMNKQIHNKSDNYLSPLKSEIRAADNSTFAICGVSFSADNFCGYKEIRFSE